jgi:hypothetical protein
MNVICKKFSRLWLSLPKNLQGHQLNEVHLYEPVISPPAGEVNYPTVWKCRPLTCANPTGSPFGITMDKQELSSRSLECRDRSGL